VGRKFALCFYANDPMNQYYHIGQWEPKLQQWWLETMESMSNGAGLPQSEILWRPLPTPPEGFDPLPAVVWETGD